MQVYFSPPPYTSKTQALPSKSHSVTVSISWPSWKAYMKQRCQLFRFSVVIVKFKVGWGQHSWKEDWLVFWGEGHIFVIHVGRSRKSYMHKLGLLTNVVNLSCLWRAVLKILLGAYHKKCKL
jgi:hypothetical protein